MPIGPGLDTDTNLDLDVALVFRGDGIYCASGDDHRKVAPEDAAAIMRTMLDRGFEPVVGVHHAKVLTATPHVEPEVSAPIALTAVTVAPESGSSPPMVEPVT